MKWPGVSQCVGPMNGIKQNKDMVFSQTESRGKLLLFQFSMFEYLLWFQNAQVETSWVGVEINLTYKCGQEIG